MSEYDEEEPYKEDEREPIEKWLNPPKPHEFNVRIIKSYSLEAYLIQEGQVGADEEDFKENDEILIDFSEVDRFIEILKKLKEDET